MLEGVNGDCEKVSGLVGESSKLRFVHVCGDVVKGLLSHDGMVSFGILVGD